MLIAGGLGLGAFWRKHRRKPAEAWGGELGPDPAEELRAKLAEHSEAAGSGEAPGALRAAADDAPSPLDPETRRRAVHEQARTSLDELK